MTAQARWPAMMKRKTAAEYCDMSEQAFEREIVLGRLPTSIMFGGREHWRKDALARPSRSFPANQCQIIGGNCGETMAKLPDLQHVKYVRSKDKLYAYFNTGKKTARGTPVYARLPDPSAVGFYDSYAAMLGGRTRRQSAGYLVADLVRDYEASMEKRADLAEGSKKNYRLTNRKVVEYLGNFPVNDVQTSDLNFMLQNKMPGNGVNNIFIAVFRKIYTWWCLNEKTNLDLDRDIKPFKAG